MLHGLRERGIIGKEMRGNILKSSSRKRSEEKKSTKSYVQEIISLNRSIEKRSRIKSQRLICKLTIKKSFQ